MLLTAAVALTVFAPPRMMPVLRPVKSGAHGWEVRSDETSLAKTLWTPILAAVAVVGERSRLGRAGRSYGFAGVLAAAGALAVLLARTLLWGFLQSRRGNPWIPWVFDVPFCPAAAKLVREAPVAAGPAVVAVWLILALTREGRRPSGWFDRLCLGFGVGWVVWSFVCDPLLSFLD